jgi:drug/metabolite transporter (DMT)-like permease
LGWVGEICALACALCWAITSVLTKSLAGKIAPLTLNFIRCLGATLFLWLLIPLVPGAAGLSAIPPTTLLFLVFSALLGMSVGDTLYIRALRLIQVTLAFPLAQAVTPLLTVGAAYLFLGEKFSPLFLVGTFLALSGIYWVAVPSGTVFPSLRAPLEKRGTGVVLILIASLFWTASIAFLKVALQNADPFLANGIRLPVSALALMPLAFFEKAGPPKPTGARWRLWFLGAFSGMLAFGVGGALFLTAIREAGAGKAMVLTSCAPLFGLPISLFFLKERVTLRTVAGTVLIVLGVAFIL